MGAGTPRALGSPLSPAVPVRPAPGRRVAGVAFDDHLAPVERGGRPDGEPPREDLLARTDLAPGPGEPLPAEGRPTRIPGHHRPLVHSGRPVPCRGTAARPLPSPVPDVRLTTPGLG